MSSRSSSGLGHHQVVAMNDLIATTVTEDVGDFTTLVPGDATDIGARIGRKTASRFAARPGADYHCVAALENPFDADHAGGQQAGAASKRPGGAVVDDDRAGRVDGCRDPSLARRTRLSASEKQGGSATRRDCGQRP